MNLNSFESNKLVGQIPDRLVRLNETDQVFDNFIKERSYIVQDFFITIHSILKSTLERLEATVLDIFLFLRDIDCLFKVTDSMIPFKSINFLIID